MRWQIAAIVIALVSVGGVAWSHFRGELSPSYVNGEMNARPGDFVKTARGLVHVSKDGPTSGGTVVLLHGINSSLYAWSDVGTVLSGRHQVIALDLPFHGLTGSVKSGNCTPADVAAFVHDVLTEMGVKSATIVGSSWGGQVGIEYAKAYPQATERLVLVATAGPRTPPSPLGRLYALPGSRVILTRFTSEDLVRGTLASAFFDSKHVTDKLVERVVLLNRRAGNRDGTFDCRLASVDAQVEPSALLVGVQAPVHIIWGEKDKWLSVDLGRAVAAAKPGATFDVIPSVGHLPMEESPTQMAALISKYLVSAQSPPKPAP